MIRMDLAEIASAVGGTLAGGADQSAVVNGSVVIDSRSVRLGDLFVAVIGDTHDGHDFADAAIASGACAVLSARRLEIPCIVVEDTVVALGLLAGHLIGRLPELIVVGVTGSSGKTSTKDLLAQVLPAIGPTIAPIGSFNNEIGLPLTALGADESTRVLVSEMGARGVGHISYLCEITPPLVGVVLNVGSAHVGEFGSRSVIADAKGELIAALPSGEAGGIAVLNADDPAVMAMASRTRARVITFGTHDHADVRIENVVLDDQGRPSADVVVEGRRERLILGLHGAHHLLNAAAVIAVGVGLKVPLEVVLERLMSARPASRWRMEVTTTSEGVTVINDAYNANPESMGAALRALIAISRHKSGLGRTSWAVLGEMRELGAMSGDAHEALGGLVVELGVDRLLVVGVAAGGIEVGAAKLSGDKGRATVVADIEAAIEVLRSEVMPGDVVLVKASRAVGLERVAAALTEVAS